MEPVLGVVYLGFEVSGVEFWAQEFELKRKVTGSRCAVCTVQDSRLTYSGFSV